MKALLVLRDRRGLAGLHRRFRDSVRFHFFGLPVGDLSGLGVESYTVKNDFLLGQFILFVVLLVFDLRESGVIIVQFELEDENVFIRFGNGVDPAVVGMRLGFDTDSQQTEQSKKNVLEVALILMVDFIRDPGEENFHSLAKPFHIAAIQSGSKFRREFYHLGLRFPGIPVQQIGIERTGDLPVREIQMIPCLPQFLLSSFDRYIPSLEQQRQRVDIVDFKGTEGNPGNGLIQ